MDFYISVFCCNSLKEVWIFLLPVRSVRQCRLSISSNFVIYYGLLAVLKCQDSKVINMEGSGKFIECVIT